MKYGLTETTVEKICAVFARFPEIEKAVLYGSRAKGNFKPGSDIDLTLCGEALTSDLRSTIASALDDLLLPYTIDLSVFNELNHAKLREHIERVGVLFYERANHGIAMKKGWQIKLLGELCRIRTGKKDVNQGNPEGEYPFFTCAASHTFSDTYSFDTEALLIAGNGDVGQVSYYKGKFEAYQRTYVLSDFIDVMPRFLYLILDGKLKDTVSKQKLGNTMPYIKMGMLTDFPVPVPPLPEQQRIVGILDEAFDGIATAKANAEKNLQNARALFESHLQSVFTQRGEGWAEKRLEDVCVLQRGFDLPTRSRVHGDFPLVSSSGIIDTHSEGPIKGPGVATGRSGSIGNVFYIGEDYWPLNTVLYVKQFHGNDPKLVYWLLKHFDLKRFATGTGVPTLNRNFVHDKRVLLPESKTRQKRIADQLDALEQETQRLESIYQQKFAALEALKKSLLHQAFSGQL